jgi:hypothetical protein
MQIGQAKQFFEVGVVTGFFASREPMGKGWIMGIWGKEGKHWLLETKLGKVKAFSSLDTLVGQIQEITGTPVGSLQVK